MYCTWEKEYIATGTTEGATVGPEGLDVGGAVGNFVLAVPAVFKDWRQDRGNKMQ